MSQVIIPKKPAHTMLNPSIFYRVDEEDEMYLAKGYSIVVDGREVVRLEADKRANPVIVISDIAEIVPAGYEAKTSECTTCKQK